MQFRFLFTLLARCCVSHSTPNVFNHIEVKKKLLLIMTSWEIRNFAFWCCESDKGEKFPKTSQNWLHFPSKSKFQHIRIMIKNRIHTLERQMKHVSVARKIAMIFPHIYSSPTNHARISHLWHREWSLRFPRHAVKSRKKATK